MGLGKEHRWLTFQIKHALQKCPPAEYIKNSSFPKNPDGLDADLPLPPTYVQSWIGSEFKDY